MDDYEIGYGKPPQRTRFKPGQSGNPRGRPKGARNAVNILRDELAEFITITENGQKKRITKLQGMVKAAVLKGLKGDPRPMIRTVELVNALAVQPAAEPDGPIEVTLVFEEEEIRALEKAEAEAREEAERLAALHRSRLDHQ